MAGRRDGGEVEGKVPLKEGLGLAKDSPGSRQEARRSRVREELTGLRD